MTISYAILDGLSSGPKTGCDLTKGFQGSIGFFWNASHQQIYRELDRIHEKGWTSVAIEPQNGKPDRKVYALTEVGRAELLAWIESPTAAAPSRNPLLVKLFVGHLGDRGKLIAELEREKGEHEKTLAQYRDLESEYFSEIHQLPVKRRFQRYTLRHGILYEGGWLAWCEEVLQDLRLEKNLGGQS